MSVFGSSSPHATIKRAAVSIRAIETKVFFI
jgi:hypothetical protein